MVKMKVDLCAAIERFVGFAGTLKSFPVAPDWDHEKLDRRLTEIFAEICFGWMAQTCARDLAIAKNAGQLIKRLERFGCADPDFLGKLRALENIAPVRGGRGGDRRSGKRNSRRQILLQEAVRLYREAHEKPGFSENGRLFHFVNGLGEAIFNGSSPFTPASIEAEFQRQRAARDFKSNGLI
jgi:hypothetical protein